MKSGWLVGWVNSHPPLPQMRKKSHRDGPRKKTISGFAGVGLPGMYRSSGESMSVGRLLIPTRRGVGGFLPITIGKNAPDERSVAHHLPFTTLFYGGGYPPEKHGIPFWEVLFYGGYPPWTWGCSKGLSGNRFLTTKNNKQIEKN